MKLRSLIGITFQVYIFCNEIYIKITSLINYIELNENISHYNVLYCIVKSLV